jgi:hypothetical protein
VGRCNVKVSISVSLVKTPDFHTILETNHLRDLPICKPQIYLFHVTINSQCDT